MIDSENLRTASLYINNQLLSRGLLRDGQSIDFADPSRGCGDGGVEATMGKVMSVVNDLILRRDVRCFLFLPFSFSSLFCDLPTTTHTHKRVHLIGRNSNVANS